MAEPLSSWQTQAQRRYWLFSIIGTLLAIIAGWAIGELGFVGAGAMIGLPIGLAVVGAIMTSPRIGILIWIQMSFLVNFLSRFSPVEAPFGLAIDGILALTFIATLINGRQMQWKRLGHPTFLLISIWFLYCCLELANPEAPYKPAWFFHVRAFSMHWFFVTFIMLVVHDFTRKDIVYLLRTWFVWSILAVLWGYKQQYLGLTERENIWMQTVGYVTHLLFGQLRVFSFFTDAAQFGAEMAGMTLVCLIFLFEEKRLPRRVMYGVLALMFFWGFAIAGTRSALFVILSGLIFYLALRRDVTKLAIGAAMGIPVLLVLMFTSIGNANYQIYRLRTALRPMEDPSFLVRLYNQRRLAAYLESKPFGAGIGTAGDAGARFSPYHWAAQIPHDSWYVELWIETGRVGLTIYVLMLLGFIIIGVRSVWRIKDPWLSTIMAALLSEFVGMAVMAYSNPNLGQFPTSSLIFINSILFTTAARWDQPVKESTPELAPTY